MNNSIDTKTAYLPLKCAGRRNFLNSSLKIPQHPRIQLAMIHFFSNHIFISVYVTSYHMRGTWLLNTRRVITQKTVQA